MSTERWSQVQALYLEAEALPEDARAEFLSDNCGDDAAMRAEVERLLLSSQATSGAFQRTDSTQPSEPVERPLTAGTRLGPWSIERLAGRGGMGEVYEAKRADGAFELRVAIKLLKRGLDSEAFVARFSRERRILAQLDHPNIARVLDAGVTGDGRPFLVMEYVEGRSLVEYARMLELGVRARLSLTITICEAVQAAHARHIVHRDLKPGNVLVTAQGQVKLLDFGVAKALAEEDTDSTRLAGEVSALTPAYASPEQLLGQSATPGGDVYALGVMLFQLLTDRLPHQRSGRSVNEIMLGLSHETTQRPSVALRKERGRLQEAHRRERIHAISGDLDRIVLKTLHAEASRRYADAGELAQDLRRFLEHKPVLARPDSLAYRASRFARRNRLAVLAMAGILLSLSGGLAAALWQAQRATREALAAQHVEQFMLDFVREQDRYRRGKSHARSLDDIIQQAIDRAATQLRDEPAARLEVLRALGYIAVDTGQIELVRKTLLPLLRDSKKIFGARSKQVADVLADLANAEYFADRGAALLYAREAVSIKRENGDAHNSGFAELEARLGALEAQDEGLLDPGLALLRDAVETFAGTAGAESPDTAFTRFQLSAVLIQFRLDRRGEEPLLGAIDTLERVLGANSIRLQAPLRVLSELRARQGRFSEAVAAADRSIEVARSNAQGRDMRVGDALKAKIGVLTRMHRYREAQALAPQALAAIPEDALTFLSAARHAVADLDLATGRWDEAEALLAQNLETRRRTLADPDLSHMQQLQRSRRAVALAHLGRMAEAESEQRQALEIYTRLFGLSGPELPEVREDLAQTLELRGAFEEAAVQRRLALATAAASYGESSAVWARSAQALAHTLIPQGGPQRLAEAQSLLDKALAAYTALPDPQPEAAALMLDQGQAWLLLGHPERARPVLAAARLLLQSDEAARTGDQADLLRRLEQQAGSQ